MSSNTYRPNAYRMSTHGLPTDDNFGNKVLKAGRIYRPSWDQTETVVRFLPTLDTDGVSWSPYRLSPGNNDFGDWIRRYPAVRMFGENNPLTLLLYDPVARPGYDVHQNPCVVIKDALSLAIRNRQEQPGWASLEKGQPGKGAPCSRHTSLYLARVSIFRHKSQDKATAQHAPLGLAEDDKQHFLEMSDTAGQSVLNMLEEKNPQYQYLGGDIDYDEMFLSGDPIRLNGGAFVHFYTDGHDPRVAAAQDAQANTGAPRQLTVGRRSDAGGGGNQREFKRYATFSEKTWKGWAPNLDFMEDILIKKDLSWERALCFYDEETQARMLQDNDCFPANLFLFAFRDRKDWIVEKTRDRAVNRTGVLMDQEQREQVAITPPMQAPPRVQQQPAAPVQAPATAQAPVQAPPKAPVGNVGGWGRQSVQEPEPGTVDPTVHVVADAPAQVEEPVEAPTIPARPPLDPRTAAAMNEMERARARAATRPAK